MWSSSILCVWCSWRYRSIMKLGFFILDLTVGLFRPFIILLLGSVFLSITFVLIGIRSNTSVFQAIVNPKTRLPKNTSDVQQLPKIERVTFPTAVRHKKDYSSIFHQYDTPVYLRIFIITYNRPTSLQKCLNSLSKLITEGYSIALEIWIDRSVNGDIDNETLKVASSFHWDQGPVAVWVHGKNVGIMGQWINTWRPVMKNGTVSPELALYVEDDVDISPYVLTFIRHLHTFYASYKNVNSYSLQGGTKIMRSSKTKKPKRDTVYMHILPGTLGMVLRPEKLIEFQNWFQEKVWFRVFALMPHKLLGTLRDTRNLKWKVEKIAFGECGSSVLWRRRVSWPFSPTWKHSLVKLIPVWVQTGLSRGYILVNSARKIENLFPNCFNIGNKAMLISQGHPLFLITPNILLKENNIVGSLDSKALGVHFSRYHPSLYVFYSNQICWIVIIIAHVESGVKSAYNYEYVCMYVCMYVCLFRYMSYNAKQGNSEEWLWKRQTCNQCFG